MSKYERDDLEQARTERVVTHVVQKISNVNIDIDEKDISVCYRQGAKVDGKQPLPVKFIISRNKRNEVLKF